MGDGETDLFDDLVAGGLLGAAALVDVASDRGDSGRRSRPLEHQEAARGGDQYPDACVVTEAGPAAGRRGGRGHAVASGRWVTTTSQLVTAGVSGVVMA